MIIRTHSAAYPAVMWAADPPPAAAPPAAEPVVEPPPAAAPTEKPADTSFLANADDPVIEKPVAAPADWPEDWRDKLAGGDAAARKRLDRFKAPTDIFKSYTELEGKFKAGKPAEDEPMPDAEKEPDKAKEWRKARGIPEDATGYAVPDSVKALVTDADKPLLTAFTEAMHTKGIPTSAAGAAMEWYFEQQAEIAEAVAAQDKTHGEALQEELRSEWGTDFRPNSTLAKRYAEKVFGDVPWTEARLPDGRRMGDDPRILRAMADAGRAEFGDVSFANSDSANKTMARKQELEVMMRDNRAQYMADPKLGKEYEAIIDAEMRSQGSRGGGSNHAPKP